jgi:hypothetical protein
VGDTMSRYKVEGVWSISRDRDPFVYEDADGKLHVLAIQTASIVDTKSSRQDLYREGAWRVATAPVDPATGDAMVQDLKPFKVGKGGTVPHYGESAWAAAARDFDDLTWKLR